MRNIIFDYGNVLVEWHPEKVYREYFGDEAQAWYFLRHICTPQWRSAIDAGLSQDIGISQLKAAHPDYAEAIELYRTRWEDMLTGEVPGMRALLTELCERPDVQLYGLTNWSMETFPAARQKFTILQLIERYVVSGDVGMVKPNPAIFRLIMERYGLDPASTTFIDDNADNVAAARSLGINGITFTSAQQLREQLLPTT